MRALNGMRSKARRLFRAGQLKDAIKLQVDVVNFAVKSSRIQVEDYNSLGAMFYRARNFPSAIVAYKLAYKHTPDFIDAVLYLGFSLVRANHLMEGLVYLTQAAETCPDNPDLLSAMAETHGRTGNMGSARHYGEKALMLKDSMVANKPQIFMMPGCHVSRFRINHPEENIISFSLFGTQECYLEGAVQNAILCTELYPGWSCRFYCDDRVPGRVRSVLTKTGAAIVSMGKVRRSTDALFWRFLVSDDPTVVRFLIRDCDSVINVREKLAVDEWIASDRHFHIMRDYCTHTDLILAGMWGGVSRVLPSITTLLSDFAYNPQTDSRIADQLFLGRVVWPMIKSSCLIHDSLYRNFSAKPFPPHSELPPGRHVGDKAFAFRQAVHSPVGGCVMGSQDSTPGGSDSHQMSSERYSQILPP